MYIVISKVTTKKSSKRIYNCKDGKRRNVIIEKNLSEGKKKNEKEKQDRWDKNKANCNIVNLTPNKSVIILNINKVNIPIKK